METTFKKEELTGHRKCIKSSSLELIPIAETRDTIRKHNLIEKDAAWMERARATYPLIDKYILFRIDELLKLAEDKLRKLDLDGMVKDIKDLDEYKKTIQKIAEKTIAPIVSEIASSNFNDAMDADWLFKNTLPDYLRSIKDYDGVVAMQEMQGALALYKQFTVSRKTAVKTSMPKRVAENFVRYAGNINAFKRLQESGTNFAKEHEEEISIYSTLNGYLFCVTPQGIAAYNNFIKGENDENGIVTMGYNGFSNEYNQQIKSNDEKKNILLKMDYLHKQILFPVEKAFSIPFINSNEQLTDLISAVMDEIPGVMQSSVQLFKTITPDTIIEKDNIHTLSNILYGRHDVIEEEAGELNIKLKAMPLSKIAEIHKDDYSYIANRLQGNIAKRMQAVLEKQKALVDAGVLICVDVRKKQRLVDMLVEYVDAIHDMARMVRLFVSKDKNATLFNNNCFDNYTEYAPTKQATNLVRNYITKSLEKQATKILMMFDCTGKARVKWWNGKDRKFAKDNHTIVEMDGKLHLLTLTDIAPVILNQDKDDANNVNVFTTTKVQSVAKHLPKFTFTKPVKEFFEANKGSTYVLKTNMREPIVVTKAQYELYKSKAYTKDYMKIHPEMDEKTYRKNVENMITFYKKAMSAYTIWDAFDFSSLRDPSEYETIQDFYDEAQALCVTGMRWIRVSKKQIFDLVKDEKALLFLITSKNMYKDGKKKGTPAEAMLSIFSKENMQHAKMELNALPDIIYRYPVIEKKISHASGSEVVNKHYKNGDDIPEDLYQLFYHYFNGRLAKAELPDEAIEMLDNVAHHPTSKDIIRNNRYTQEKFIFNFSYTIGRDIEKDSAKYIADIAEDNWSGNVMAVVRGTTDLFFYVVCNKKREIIDSGSLNIVNGINYKKKLTAINFLRKSNKAKRWIYDTKCTNIKDTYIADVASKVADLALENNAIIAVEDLFDETREKWACIDFQTFSKFIKLLNTKLSVFRVKNVTGTAPGSILNPLQLSYVKSSKEPEAYKQGILNKVSETYIRNVDSETGFISMFDFKELNSTAKRRDFFKSFDKIEIKKDVIAFTFDYKRTKIRKNARYHKSKWTVLVQGKRSLYDVETKKNVLHEDIVKYLLQTLEKNKEKIETTDLISCMDDLKAKSVNLLFEVFKTCVYGTVKNQELGLEYRVSPVTGKEDYDFMKTRAMLLIEKYLYLEQNRERIRDDGLVAADEWVRHLQTSRAS